MIKHPCRLFILFAMFAARALADVSLPVAFSDHAVLQRGKPVPVWGWADPGEKVSVTFRGASVSAAAAADGAWRVALPPMQAAGEGGDLVIAGKNTITLKDVVVGEVWFCSGQSNMAYGIDKAVDAEKISRDSADPLLRIFRAARFVQEQPAIRKHDPAARTKPGSVVSDKWLPVTPAMLGQHSAVAYLFAKNLRARLGVPVGVITSSFGGSPIESWLPPETLASTSVAAETRERWQSALTEYPRRKAAYDKAKAAWDKADDEAKKAGKTYAKRAPKAPTGPGSHHTPSGLYNGMVYPYCGYALRGFVWYQGESNTTRAGDYAELFRALITSWRKSFAQGDAYFLWVQLPRYTHSQEYGWALLREAQAAQLALPRTGQAVTIDLPIPTPNEVHPPEKRPVGERLARVAAGLAYDSGEEYMGPRFDNIKITGRTARVGFSHTEGGLVAKGPLEGAFEIAGADGVWHAAQAKLDGDAVILTSDKVAAPAAARYLFRNYVETAPLYNKAGLPAEPFRTGRHEPGKM